VVAGFQRIGGGGRRVHALAGVAPETGVIMLIYVDHALREQRQRCDAEGREFVRADLNRAILVGALRGFVQG
jgi:hypothetical protein